MSALAGLTGRRRRGGQRPSGVGLVGLMVVLGYVTVAVVGPAVAPFDAVERVGAPFGRPDAVHLLGTDDVGRDLWSQLLLGTRASLLVAAGTGLLAVVLGALVGSTAGLLRGPVDAVLMRLVDVVLVLPFLPLLIVASAFGNRSLLTQVVLIGLLSWARPARLVRAAALEARSRGHVEVAEGMGATRRRVLWRHLSVGIAPLLVPLALRAATAAVLLEASLSFLGLGDPSRASWGTTLYWANVRSVFLTDAWAWWVLPPGLAIAGLVVGLGLLGVHLERRLDPARHEDAG